MTHQMLDLSRRNLLRTSAIACASAFGLGTGVAGASSGCDDRPLDVVLVLQKSNDEFSAIQETAKRVVDHLGPNDRVSVLGYEYDHAVDLHLTGNEDFAVAKQTIDDLQYDDYWKYLAQAVNTAHEYELTDYGRSDATQIILVLSDGEQHSKVAADPVKEADEAKTDGIRVTTMAFGSSPYTGTLQEMASDPQSDNYFHSDTAKADDVVAGICPSVDDHLVDGGVYRIENVNSAKVLEVQDAGTSDGDAVQQWDYLDYDHQKWIAHEIADGRYWFENVHSGKALDIEDASTQQGALTMQWEWWGGENQQWDVHEVADGLYHPVNVNSGWSLDVDGASTDDGARGTQWKWWCGDNQLWRFERLD